MILLDTHALVWWYHGRITLSADLPTWIATIQKLRRVSFIPVDNRIAVTSVELPGQFHKDPADRIIVATAIVKNIPPVTVDQKIRAYAHVQTIW